MQMWNEKGYDGVWRKDINQIEFKWKDIKSRCCKIKDKKLKQSGLGADDIQEWEYFDQVDQIVDGSFDYAPALVDTTSASFQS